MKKPVILIAMIVVVLAFIAFLLIKGIGLYFPEAVIIWLVAMIVMVVLFQRNRKQ